MVFNRQAAVNYLKNSVICNGLVMEYPGRAAREGFQRVFVTTDMALVGTVLKMVGDPLWTLIRDTAKVYLDKFDYYGSTKTRSYLYPILDQAVIPNGPSFHGAVIPSIVFYDNPTALPNDDLHPTQILHDNHPTDNLSSTCGDIVYSNLGFMRALYHWQQGQTSTANTCYDAMMAAMIPEGFGIADDAADLGHGEPYSGVYRYVTYKTMIQWIVAKDMGRARVVPEWLDMMQDPAHGGVRTFCKTNFSFISPDDHNTETTSLAIIADMRWNPVGSDGGAGTPVPVLDAFGIKQIYSSKSGGSTWSSTTWDDSVREFGTPGECEEDPDDSRLIVASAGDPEIKIDGKGHMNMHSSTGDSGSPRVVITGTWRNVESSVYIRCPTDHMAANLDIRSKTQHYCIDTCGGDSGCFGGYIHNIDFEQQTSGLRKEKTHAAGYSNRKSVVDVSLKANIWIGFKGICYNMSNGHVKLETWIDRTGGANGGTWEKLTEAVDDGTWGGEGGSGIQTLMCEGSAIRVNLNSEPGANANLDFKYWTIREINPPVL